MNENVLVVLAELGAIIKSQKKDIEIKDWQIKQLRERLDLAEAEMKEKNK